MSLVFESFPCREKEVDQLRSLITSDGGPLPESIFIHGQPSVGKTSVTSAFFQAINAQWAYVNCLECYTTRLLLEPIINSLVPSDTPVRCDTYLDLVHRLKLVGKSAIHSKRSMIVVLDGVEHLDKTDDSCVNFFVKLQELTSIHNLSVVFIGRVAPEKFGIVPTVVLHFPQYTKDELMKIFKLYKPSDIEEELYSAYISSAVAVFLRTTRDLVEMKNLILKNVKKYVEPVIRGEVASTDVHQLWRLVAPHLRESLNSAYLGISHEDDKSCLSNNNTELIIHKKLRVLDLPYYAKYFLIAGYLASYNLPKYDRRLFMKNHGKQKKTLRKAANRHKDMKMFGPKSFSLDRLLAIFYAIMESKASLTVNLMSQIATLVELRLFVKMGDGIDNPKFKCLAIFDCVTSVADTLGFSLKKHLLD